ncbi:UNKNOWN [Stylonychia lemnae]|uniref:Uncharacterized protein n=1 Tax=Stylonychia lemnae TaxID=5949 RepID=A0A078AJM0_STYLE|nr:UNKNOWN [Stylonychia lemnae]|eukprot:CDW82565.1 UNKNOWN [Stylonychia lemnae]
MEKTEQQLYGSLLPNITKKVRGISSKKLIIAALATLACSSAIYINLTGSNQSDLASLSQTHSQSFLQDTSSKWRKLNPPKGLDYPNSMDNLQISPEGNLWATAYLGQQDDSEEPTYGTYYYNFTTEIWGRFRTWYDVDAIDFSHLSGSDEDNMLLYDSENNLHQYSKKDFQMVKRVSALEISPSGAYHILRDESLGDSDEPLDKLKQHLSTQGTPYTIYESSEVSNIELRGEEAVVLTQDDTLRGYGDLKFENFKIGNDNSLWGLNLDDKNSNFEQTYDSEDYRAEYQLLKWNDQTQQWDKIEGVYAMNFAVLDSERLAILDSKNQIWVNFD